MNQKFGRYALFALAAIVIGTLENLFFGADHGGFKHHLSVAFFFIAAAGFVALVVIAVVYLVRRIQIWRAAA